MTHSPAVEALVGLIPKLEMHRTACAPHDAMLVGFTISAHEANIIIAAAKELAARDETHVWVPKEPTQKMLDAVTAADQRPPWNDKEMRGSLSGNDRSRAMTPSEARKAALEALVKSAYNEAFIEGGREHTTYNGGNPWRDSKSKRQLDDLISSAHKPVVTAEEVITEISSDFDKAGTVIDDLISAIEKRFPETLDTNVLASTDMGKGLLKAYRELKAFIESSPTAPKPVEQPVSGDDMVERVARAIYATKGHCYTDDERMFQPFPWEEADEILKEVSRTEARAALAAIRALISSTPAEVEGDDVVKALEWYGEQARLCRLIHSEGDDGRHALSNDGGNRARAALAAIQPEVK